MKKIGLIIGDITKKNGTERAVVSLAKILVNILDYSVCIISVNSSSGESGFELPKERIKIIHLNINPLDFNKSKIQRLWFSYYKITTTLRNICIKNSLNAIIGSDTSINCLLSMMPRNVKRIGCEHFNYDAFKGITSIKRRIAYPFLDAVILLTDSDATHYSFIHKKFVIPNCFPFSNTKDNDSVEKYNQDEKIIISVGRYTMQKGFDLLIESMSIIHSVLPEWKLRIYGNGDMRSNLISLIRKFNLESVVSLCDFCNNIEEKYKEAQIYAMSSRYEGFGLVLIEAMMCGLPCVAYDIESGPSEIIKNGVDGFLVKPFDINDFARKIIYLCENLEKRREMGKYAMKNVKRFSPESIAKKWMEMFRQIGIN